MSDYTKFLDKKNETAQSQPLRGREQDMHRNAAGGYVFTVDKWAQLDRFLILGTESNTYYTSARSLTREAATNVEACLREDGLRVVARTTEISVAGRAPKNDPAIFVLALAAKLGNEVTRKAAFAAVPKVCRIGTHLFHFARDVDALGGWGRGTKRAIANWYRQRSVESLAYQALKYQTRDGWSHRDLLRLSHVKANNAQQNAMFRYIVKGVANEIGSLPELVDGFERAKVAVNARATANLIRKYGLPRELVQTEHLNDPEVWTALLEQMPMTALIRNLAKMTTVGVIAPLSAGTKEITRRLSDRAELHKARIHPMQMLIARMTYMMGHGVKGSLHWSPVAQVTDALDAAFYTTFESVTPTGKNFLLALDVSGSMGSGQITGAPGMTPCAGAAALAMLTARTERNYHIVGFADRVRELGITATDSLDVAMRKASMHNFGSTDCAAAYQYAQANKLDVDAFVVITDNETGSARGRQHPVQALNAYRRAGNAGARSVIVGMTATSSSIADPTDAGMLDIVGFDAAIPRLIADFVAPGRVEPEYAED